MGDKSKLAILAESRTQALGALANNTAILIGTKLAVTTPYRMLKALVNLNLVSLTGTQGGALFLGLARGDLTVGEIGEALLVNGPLGPGAVIEKEKAMRRVWLVARAVARGIELVDIQLEPLYLDKDDKGGCGIVVKPRWTFDEGTSWNWFIWNAGTALTTGATARLFTKLFGVWV